jgi:hypothetical protein
LRPRRYPAQLYCDPARDIAALLVARLGTADIDVIQRARLERRNLGKCGTDHSGGKIIGTDLCERSLAGATDRRTHCSDNDGFGAFKIDVRHRDHNPRSRPMSSFMISFEPAQILEARASAHARATRYSFM